jgi:hypothetical protein
MNAGESACSTRMVSRETRPSSATMYWSCTAALIRALSLGGQAGVGCSMIATGCVALMYGRRIRPRGMPPGTAESRVNRRLSRIFFERSPRTFDGGGSSLRESARLTDASIAFRASGESGEIDQESFRRRPSRRRASSISPSQDPTWHQRSSLQSSSKSPSVPGHDPRVSCAGSSNVLATAMRYGVYAGGAADDGETGGATKKVNCAVSRCAAVSNGHS